MILERLKSLVVSRCHLRGYQIVVSTSDWLKYIRVKVLAAVMLEFYVVGCTCQEFAGDRRPLSSFRIMLSEPAMQKHDKRIVK
jgi:hypothetical protein